MQDRHDRRCGQASSSSLPPPLQPPESAVVTPQACRTSLTLSLVTPAARARALDSTCFSVKSRPSDVQRPDRVRCVCKVCVQRVWWCWVLCGVQGARSQGATSRQGLRSGAGSGVAGGGERTQHAHQLAGLTQHGRPAAHSHPARSPDPGQLAMPLSCAHQVSQHKMGCGLDRQAGDSRSSNSSVWSLWLASITCPLRISSCVRPQHTKKRTAEQHESLGLSPALRQGAKRATTVLAPSAR